MARKTLGFNVTKEELKLIEDVRFGERHDSFSDLFRDIVLPAIRRRHRKLFSNGSAGPTQGLGGGKGALRAQPAKGNRS